MNTHKCKSVKIINIDSVFIVSFPAPNPYEGLVILKPFLGCTKGLYTPKGEEDMQLKKCPVYQARFKPDIGL